MIGLVSKTWRTNLPQAQQAVADGFSGSPTDRSVAKFRSVTNYIDIIGPVMFAAWVNY